MSGTAIPSTMTAFRIERFGEPPRFVEMDVPVPSGPEILVRVAAVGLCHSDITMMSIDEPTAQFLGWAPFTLGHETAGWVAQAPATSRFSVRDPVAVVSPSSCGTCTDCTDGRDSLCESGATGRGYGRDGGLADFVLVDSDRSLVALGAIDPFIAGPLTDAGATAMHAVNRVRPRLATGGSVAIIGIGGLGLYALQIVKAVTAARVIAVDSNPDRLELAAEYGADEACDLTAFVRSSEPCDVVLDFVGVDGTIAAGLARTRRGGAFGLIGAGGGGFSKPWYGSLPPDAEIFTYQGSNISDLADVIALVDQGRVQPVVDHFEFDDVRSAYEALDAGRLRGRAVVRMAGHAPVLR